jgi:hypothetical protein
MIEHSIVKLRSLLESDEEIRKSERKYKESGDVQDFIALLRAKQKARKLITQRTPPRSPRGWHTIATTFEAQMPRPVSPRQRFIQLSFRHPDIRSIFMQATDVIRPQLSISVLRSADQPGLYPVEIELGRSIRAPGLVSVRFQQSTAPLDHPQVQGQGFYNAPQMIDFSVGGRDYNTIVGAGTRDHTSLWRLRGDTTSVYFLSYYTGIPYVGITEYTLNIPSIHGENIPEEGYDRFLQGDEVEENLGQRGLDLSEQQIVRRLLPEG